MNYQYCKKSTLAASSELSQKETLFDYFIISFYSNFKAYTIVSAREASSVGNLGGIGLFSERYSYDVIIKSVPMII